MLRSQFSSNTNTCSGFSSLSAGLISSVSRSGLYLYYLILTSSELEGHTMPPNQKPLSRSYLIQQMSSLNLVRRTPFWRILAWLGLLSLRSL